MSKSEPLNLEDIWDWFERKFGVDAMDRYYGYETIELINEIKRRVRKACEFYLRYRDKPELLTKEHYHLLKGIEKEDKWAFLLLFAAPQKIKIKNINTYNKWLFRLAFKGVSDNETIERTKKG